jgi:FHA domain-containing protein/zinc ribbon family protein
MDALAGNPRRAVLDTFITGTLAGAGSFRCAGCGFHVAVRTADLIPECPHCGEAKFVRTSMFDVAEPDTSDLHDDDIGWLEDLRDGIHDEGHWLALCDVGRVSMFAVTQEWTRIGRSLTADIRLDDPTVSRRHALLCRQEGRVRVLDDRSLNGLFLNGERVEWHDLEDNDELVIGRYRLHFIDTTEHVLRSGIGAAATLA